MHHQQRVWMHYYYYFYSMAFTKVLFLLNVERCGHRQRVDLEFASLPIIIQYLLRCPHVQACAPSLMTYSRPLHVRGEVEHLEGLYVCITSGREIRQCIP